MNLPQNHYYFLCQVVWDKDDGKTEVDKKAVIFCTDLSDETIAAAEQADGFLADAISDVFGFCIKSLTYTEIPLPLLDFLNERRIYKPYVVLDDEDVLSRLQ